MRVSICSLVVNGSSGPTTGMAFCLALAFSTILEKRPWGTTASWLASSAERKAA
jgi:hypothetical protein